LAPSAISPVDALAAHWAAIDAARTAAGFDASVPAHAVTIAEYVERKGVGYQAARNQLDKLVALGQMAKGRKLGVGKDGRQFQAACYWMLNP
jgi:hypothetical protein